MSTCVFCRIASGELPAHELLKTETVFAFLDRTPLTRGHALVIPRSHAVTLQELPESVSADLGRAIHHLLPLLLESVQAPAATIALHNGREAGQEVPHVHWHVVPRTRGDGAGPIHALFRNRPQIDDAEQSALAARIRDRLSAPSD